MQIAIVSYVSPFIRKGFSPGHERVVSSIVRNFVSNGVEVHLFTSYWPDSISRARNLHPPEEIKDSRGLLHIYTIKNTYIGALSSNIISFNIFLRKYIHILKQVDVIQIMQTSFIPLKPFENLPLVVSYHDHIQPIRLDLVPLTNEPTNRFLKFVQYKNSDVVLVSIPKNSKEFQDFLRVYRVSTEKIRFIWEGVDTEMFNPKTYCDEIKFQYGGPIILFVSSLHPRKGIRYLIMAMPKILKEIPDAKLLIFGEGYQGKYLQHLTKKLELEKNVIFGGFIRDELLPRFYASADVYAYPALVDGWPLTPMEAMACGTPVVGSNLGAIREIVQDAGMLCEPRNSKQLAEAIIELLLDKNLRNEFREKGLNLVKRKFTWQKICERYIQIYEEFLEKS